MKQCILFGNCHCSGVKKFLEFSNFYEKYEVHQFANWDLIKDDEKMVIPIHLIKNADLIIYQPLSDVHNCYSTNRQNPDSFFSLLKEECHTVSFPRIHNNAIFPIFHKNAKGDFIYGNINNTVKTAEELLYLYRNDQIDYNFTERMAKNYYISKKKEEECDVKIADFLLDNISKQKLFLTQDHPTSFVFNELTKNICEQLDIEYDYEKGSTVSENITKLQDSVYRRRDCQYPISRYAMNHFHFKYIDKEQDDADSFYWRNTLEYFLHAEK